MFSDRDIDDKSPHPSDPNSSDAQSRSIDDAPPPEVGASDVSELRSVDSATDTSPRAAEASEDSRVPDPLGVSEAEAVISTDLVNREAAEPKLEEETRVPSPEVAVFEPPWMHGLKPGDMVWGKVKSHPWWPGHVFHEVFASPVVRRSKREGHMLIAFFGDSSYGWFDPAELIPFEPNYAEKSHQTSHRSFIKAVEESADELSRRQALGLTCRCRAPSNFHPVNNMKGFLTVNVAGYEAAVYSSEQIRKAREAFVPSEAVGFVRGLALVPREADFGSVGLLKDMAKMLAYRRAVFEEYDETYAQAFGIEPVKPLPNAAGGVEMPRGCPLMGNFDGKEVTFSCKVNTVGDYPFVNAAHSDPLSGPLVIAEELGEKKATRPIKTREKESSKKNRYLLKRRESPVLPTSSSGGPKSNFSSFTAAATAPPLAQPQPPSHVHYISPGQPNLTSLPIFKKPPPHTAPAAQPGGDYVFQKRSPPPPAVPSPKAPEPRPLPPTDWKPSPVTVSSDAKPSIGTVEGQNAEGGAKQERMGVGVAAETPSTIGQAEKMMKKKKKKIDAAMEIGLDRPPAKRPKKAKDVESPKRPSLRPSERTGGSSVPPQSDSASLTDVEFPHLLGDLSALALDPFYGAERDASAVALAVFLKFRSLVYQKSLVLPPASEPTEASEFKALKTSSAGEPAPRPRLPKPGKQTMKPDDPTRMGRKRGLSDRQEEKSVKRLKKITQIKALASEKKAVVVGSKPPETDKKAAISVAPPPKPVKKPEPPPVRVVSPTALVIKFPMRSSLPSVPVLKARFAKFGPLDVSGIRVYWKSYTCKVVFRYKADAEAACEFAMKNGALFGQIKVSYSVRELDAPVPAPEPLSDQNRQRGEDHPDDGLSSFRPGGVNSPRPGQPKSILKKPPSGDESTPAGGPARETPRVKFNLGGEETQRAEPTVGSPPRPASVGMDYNNGKAVKLANLLPPLFPNPPRYPEQPMALPPPPPPPQVHRMVDSRPPPLMQPHYRTPPDPRPPPMYPPRVSDLPPEGRHVDVPARSAYAAVDISRPMIDLLMRCRDIVSNVSGTLGYVPYHPL
ncbi:hypothetical protein QJS10_CPB17g01369 [Acorus calamus]|uniref:PWWP domain-containing protein n=1 Tax=Acorus calamus TaxID=4465 RepID=A0AAV9CRV7_ACOCL|nr:hypothetical protein QJS10_CPB17g01369 [Acorus calamus]